MTEQINLRKSFGEYLEKLGTKQKNILVIDTDLKNSLYTLFFGKSYPERHFTLGLNEAIAPGVAAGMTVRKKIPFLCSEAAPLLGKGLDMLKNSVCLPNLNLKIVITGGGLANIEDGTPMTMTDDLAILQTLPNLKILCPIDQHELRSMMDFMISDYGPTILRIPRTANDGFYDSNYQFQLGEPVRFRNGDQISIISYGENISEIAKTCTELEKRGISAQIINLATISPLNSESLINLCINTELIVTVESHIKNGGISSLIQNIFLHKNKKFLAINLDNLPESSKYQDALNRSGLSAKSIYESIREKWISL